MSDEKGRRGGSSPFPQIDFGRLQRARESLGVKASNRSWPHRPYVRGRLGPGTELIGPGGLPKIRPNPQGILIDEDGNTSVVYILKTHASRLNLASEPLGPLYISVPRYHFTDCNTLRAMRRMPFIETGGSMYEARYVKITMHGDDDLFPCIPKPLGGDWRSEHTIYVRLLPCMHCLRSIPYPGYLQCSLGEEREKFVLSFSLAEFFREYGKDVEVSILPSRTPDDADAVPNPDNYNKGWDQASRAAKERAGWRCECCSVACRSFKDGLHTHHVNKQRRDDRPENLQVLCVLCHGARHAHLSPRVQKYEREMTNLRRAQGLPDYCPECGG